MEVIVAGYLEYDALLPGTYRRIYSLLTSHFLGRKNFAVDIQDTWTVTDLRSMISLIALGLAFGLCRTMLFRTSSESKEIFRGKNLNSADPHSVSWPFHWQLRCL